MPRGVRPARRPCPGRLEHELRVHGVDGVHRAVDQVRRGRSLHRRSSRHPTADDVGNEMCPRSTGRPASRSCPVGVRREHERLERRSGLPSAPAALAGPRARSTLQRVVVASADVGTDRASTLVERDDGGLRVVGTVEHLRHRIFGRPLIIEIERRRDAQTTAVDTLSPNLSIASWRTRSTNHGATPRRDLRRSARSTAPMGDCLTDAGVVGLSLRLSTIASTK